MSINRDHLAQIQQRWPNCFASPSEPQGEAVDISLLVTNYPQPSQ